MWLESILTPVVVVVVVVAPWEAADWQPGRTGPEAPGRHSAVSPAEYPEDTRNSLNRFSCQRSDWTQPLIHSTGMANANTASLAHTARSAVLFNRKAVGSGQAEPPQPGGLSLCAAYPSHSPWWPSERWLSYCCGRVGGEQHAVTSGKTQALPDGTTSPSSGRNVFPVCRC